MAYWDAVETFPAPGTHKESGQLYALVRQVAALLVAEVFDTHPVYRPGKGRLLLGDVVSGVFTRHVYASMGLCGRCGQNGEGRSGALLASALRSGWPS